MADPIPWPRFVSVGWLSPNRRPGETVLGPITTQLPHPYWAIWTGIVGNSFKIKTFIIFKCIIGVIFSFCLLEGAGRFEPGQDPFSGSHSQSDLSLSYPIQLIRPFPVLSLSLLSLAPFCAAVLLLLRRFSVLAVVIRAPGRRFTSPKPPGASPVPPSESRLLLASYSSRSGGEGCRAGMDGSAPYNPRTVEEVYRDFKGRRAGIIKALTTGCLSSPLLTRSIPLFVSSLRFFRFSLRFSLWIFGQLSLISLLLSSHLMLQTWKTSTSSVIPVSGFSSALFFQRSFD